MNNLESVITYLKDNLDSIELFYNDFFTKKYTEKTLCFSFPPISKEIKKIDTILDTSNDALWQCIFAKNNENKINYIPENLLPKVQPFLLEVNFNFLKPKTNLPEHSDNYDRTIIHILLNDLDGDSYISLEKKPLFLRKKFDIVSFNYNKLHGAVNESNTTRKTIAFLFNRVL